MTKKNVNVQNSLSNDKKDLAKIEILYLDDNGIPKYVKATASFEVPLDDASFYIEAIEKSGNGQMIAKLIY